MCFFRIFSSNRQQANNDDAPLLDNAEADDVDIIIRPETRSRSIPSGNNILNSNHSGSFREENEVVASAVRAHRSAPNIMQRDEPSTSGTPRRLGVAAIPNNIANIQFLSSTQPRFNDSTGRE